MNSEKRQWGVDHVDKSEIVPNRHVLFFIVSREIAENVPLKPLILTPPAKIVDILFRLAVFFSVC